MPADGEVRALLKCHLPVRKSRGGKKDQFTETEQAGVSLCLDCLVVRGYVTAGKHFHLHFFSPSPQPLYGTATF